MRNGKIYLAPNDSYEIFLLAGPSGGGCWYKAKCEMLLRKIEGEMNVQNCGFSTKLRNGDGGDMLHD